MFTTTPLKTTSLTRIISLACGARVSLQNGLPNSLREDALLIEYLISHPESAYNEKDQSALKEKAERFNISLVVLETVFFRGLRDWCHQNDSSNTIKQHAFNRVNSFLVGGRASLLDSDLSGAMKLQENCNPNKYGDIVQKVKRHVRSI